MSRTHYTLFVFSNGSNNWEDVFGSFSRAECVEEARKYFTSVDHKKIIKNDGTHLGVMKNFAELGRRVQDLYPSDEDLVIFNAVQFPRSDDRHLYNIVGHYNGQWITTLFNNDSKGFFCPHYFGDDRSDAEADFRANVGAEFEGWTMGHGFGKFDSLEAAYEAAITRRDSIEVAA